MNNQPIIRRARPQDLQSVWDTFLISFDDMIRRVHARPGSTRYPHKPPAYLLHVLETDPETFWVAESSRRIVGFACAIVRGAIWFL